MFRARFCEFLGKEAARALAELTVCRMGGSEHYRGLQGTSKSQPPNRSLCQALASGRREQVATCPQICCSA